MVMPLELIDFITPLYDLYDTDEDEEENVEVENVEGNKNGVYKTHHYTNKKNKVVDHTACLLLAHTTTVLEELVTSDSLRRCASRVSNQTYQPRDAGLQITIHTPPLLQQGRPMYPSVPAPLGFVPRTFVLSVSPIPSSRI
jgi:hypothetical protein